MLITQTQFTPNTTAVKKVYVTDNDRLSAHLGNPYLTLGNENVRSRTSAALGVVCDAAVHRPLDTHTQATRARVRVKFRPQNSHVVKLERCALNSQICQI